MLCLGFKPEAARWKAVRDPQRYGDFPSKLICCLLLIWKVFAIASQRCSAVQQVDMGSSVTRRRTKMQPNFVIDQLLATAVLALKVLGLQNSPKAVKYFCKKIVAKMVKKQPNLVTLEMGKMRSRGWSKTISPQHFVYTSDKLV